MHILCAARPPLRATFAVTRTGGHGCCVHPRCCQATVDVNARGARKIDTDHATVAIDALPHSIALFLCTSPVLPADHRNMSRRWLLCTFSTLPTHHRPISAILHCWSRMLCTSSLLPARHAHQHHRQSAVHIHCAASLAPTATLTSIDLRCAHALCCQPTTQTKTGGSCGA